MLCYCTTSRQAASGDDRGLAFPGFICLEWCELDTFKSSEKLPSLSTCGQPSKLEARCMASLRSSGCLLTPLVTGAGQDLLMSGSSALPPLAFSPFHLCIHDWLLAGLLLRQMPMMCVLLMRHFGAFKLCPNFLTSMCFPASVHLLSIQVRPGWNLSPEDGSWEVQHKEPAGTP